MGTSVYFNNQNATREQYLVEDLIIESIKNHGIDIYYIPRDSHSTNDELYGDDPVKKFTKAYSIEMYLESSNDFEGNQEFFGKFGLEIQKAAKVAVARRTFERYIPTSVRNLPKEGDLIWLPVQQKLMEVRFVEEEKNFFQAGKVAPYMYGLNLEVFKYNGELIQTGIQEIDDITDQVAFAINFTLASGGTGSFREDEVVYQGTSLSAATARGYVAGWDISTRIVKVRNIKGEFAAGAIVGSTSGAQWTISALNDQENANDLYDDNVRIQGEASDFIDFTENNPFGEP